MANYLEQYQYQPIAPANTNIEQIAKTFQTKVAYWAQGASQVKSAYQNYLGLSLTRSDNQQALSDYMKDAKTKLQTATMTDLSIGENVGKALDVFDPITNDRNIMGDHALTSKLTESINRGENTANINSGKDYSSKNVQYLRNKLNDFRNDDKRESWAGYMATGTEYTPYTDTAKWLMETMKEYEPSQYIQTKVDNNGYLKTTEIMSHLPNDIRRHLMATMPDKVKRQLQIDGAVDFYGKEDYLKISYVDDYKNLISTNGSRIKEIDLLLINAPKDKQRELQAEKENLDTEIKTSTKMLQDIQSDPEFIKKNRDMFAGNTTLKQYINAVSTGLAKTIEKYTVTPDNAWLAKFRVHNEAIQNQLDRESREFIASQNNATQLQVAMIRGGKGTKASGELENPILDPNAIPTEVPFKTANIGEEVKVFNEIEANSFAAFDSFANSLTVGEREAYTKLNPEAKLQFFEEHFKDKTAKFNQVEKELADLLDKHKREGRPLNEELTRKKLYDDNGLTPFVRYKEALEEYTHAKETRDRAQAYTDNVVFKNLPDKIILDKDFSGTDIAISKGDYKKILEGTSDKFRVYVTDEDGGQSVVPKNTMKTIMQEYKESLHSVSDWDLKAGSTWGAGVGKHLEKILEKHGVKGESLQFQIKGADGSWKTIDVDDSTIGLGTAYRNEYQSKFKAASPEFRNITTFEIRDDDEIKRLKETHNNKANKENPYTAFYRDSKGNVYGKRLTPGEGTIDAYGIDRETVLENNPNYAFDLEKGLQTTFKNIKRSVEIEAQETNYTHAIVYRNPITSPKKNSFKISYERSPNNGQPVYTLYKYAVTPAEKEKAFTSGELNGHKPMSTFTSMYEVQEAIKKL